MIVVIMRTYVDNAGIAEHRACMGGRTERL